LIWQPCFAEHVPNQQLPSSEILRFHENNPNRIKVVRIRIEIMTGLKDVLLKEAEETYLITEKLFHRVADDELSWKPATGKDWMTVGQLMMHCASFGCGKAIQGFVKGDWGLPAGARLEDLGAEDHVPPPAALPSVESVEHALGLLAEDRNLTVSCIVEAEEGELLGEAFTAPWGGPKLPLFHHLLRMVAHLAQHKGQLFYYLKLMGKEVDTKDLWGE
jgi:hypothetical protein